MESKQPALRPKRLDNADHKRYSSQMRSSHHRSDRLVMFVRVWDERQINLPIDKAVEIDKSACRVRDIYLQPAALNLRAYIFPMSPMPMRPTLKSSISEGTTPSMIVPMQDNYWDIQAASTFSLSAQRMLASRLVKVEER